MKFFTIALFIGAIQANELQDLQDEVDLLKIRISRAGQAAIEDQANDIPVVAKKIKNSKPVRNLKSSLERFAHTAEVANIKKIDRAFIKSPEGQRLIAEWKDVFETIDKNLYKNKTGVHYPNEHMDELSDELNDVAHQYEKLEGSKWDKAWHGAWEKALATKQAKSVGRRFESFVHSKEGQMLAKEVKELKMAIHQHVKVSDVPDSWKKQQNLLKVHISPEGQAAIEKEFKDLEDTVKADKDSRPYRNLGSSIGQWAESQEMKQLEALDRQFMASPEGKELMREWKDFGDALGEHVYHNDTGFHIDNEGLKVIEDEADDIDYQYKKLAKSQWAPKYDQAFKKVFSNPQAQALDRRMGTFMESPEGQRLHKELQDVCKSLEKNVEVSDVPEDWKMEMNMLKVEISREGEAAIEKEIEDIHDVRQKIKLTKAVRNMKSSLERWALSPEVQSIKGLNKRFWASKEGLELKAEIRDFAESLKEHVKKTPRGIHIDHEGYQIIEDEADDVEYEYKTIGNSKWAKEYDMAFEKAFTNKQAASVDRRFKTFTKSDEFKMLAKELKDLDMALKKHVKVTDVPEDMYLY